MLSNKAGGSMPEAIKPRVWKQWHLLGANRAANRKPGALRQFLRTVSRTTMRGTLCFFFMLSALCLSCVSPVPYSCKRPFFSREEIVRIVQAEIARQGGDPSSVETSKIRIKRRGCDYLYYQVDRPKRPGGYLFVLLDETGKILDYHQGL